MKWNKSTRFALYACMEMARADGDLVTIPSVAERYGISSNHLAKVMRQLVRSGLAEAVRGVGGGYRLLRKPKEITLLDVVEIFEGPVGPDVDPPSGRPAGGDLGRLRRVFEEIEEQAYFTLKSTLLSTVVPPRRPVSD